MDFKKIIHRFHPLIKAIFDNKKHQLIKVMGSVTKIIYRQYFHLTI